MNFETITRYYPKCPLKSIYQYRSDVFPVWFYFHGYGRSGHGKEITGAWGCVFSFAIIDNPEILVDHVKPGGLLIYRGTKLNDPFFTLIHEGDYFVYEQVRL